MYYDKKRVASFLSQFNNFGHLKELTEGESASRTKSESTSGGVSGGIPAVISGDASHDAGTGASYSNDTNRIYDPTWTNALSFLDYLSEKQLLNRDISNASIGQFVLHSGALNILDLSLIEKTWGLPTFQKTMRSGASETMNRAARRRAEKNAANDEGINNLELFIEMMGILPHTAQATVDNGDSKSWCSLTSEGLIINSSDITLKHGHSVPGTWNIVGILDAKPELLEDDNPELEPNFDDGTEIAGKLMQMLAPVAKNMVGRPDSSYGMTPILIFREVKN